MKNLTLDDCIESLGAAWTLLDTLEKREQNDQRRIEIVQVKAQLNETGQQLIRLNRKLRK